MTNSAAPSWDHQIEERLTARNVRYTDGRRRAVAALAASDGPLSAAELHERLADAVPLSSLYRTLGVLEDAGVVVPHFGAKGVTRYELAEWITGHHHHLICLDCGSVEDVILPRPYEAKVHGLVEDIGGLAAFTPSSHALEIAGQCARCA